ncbi:MAG: hypothetical protein OEX02_00945 [Cyclobacteriaceae bacterium]|nr:hypothetical protein [Cyclobacteriaceae bacterium]
MTKNKKDKKPHVHPDLEGFNIEIDSFGELKSNINIEKINEFLNKTVTDKKLKERKDYDEIRKKGKFEK